MLEAEGPEAYHQEELLPRNAQPTNSLEGFVASNEPQVEKSLTEMTAGELQDRIDALRDKLRLAQEDLDQEMDRTNSSATSQSASRREVTALEGEIQGLLAELGQRPEPDPDAVEEARQSLAAADASESVDDQGLDPEEDPSYYDPNE